MLIERGRSALTGRCRKSSDRYTGTGDPVCPTVRRPGAALATDLEPVATYLEFLMAAISSARRWAGLLGSHEIVEALRNVLSPEAGEFAAQPPHAERVVGSVAKKKKKKLEGLSVARLGGEPGRHRRGARGVGRAPLARVPLLTTHESSWPGTGRP